MNSNVIPEQSYTRSVERRPRQGQVLHPVRRVAAAVFHRGRRPGAGAAATVRTQLDYFQRVIPLLWDSFTVYALDLPGMGWSDIAAGASYEAPDLVPRWSSSSRHQTCTRSRWR